MPFRLDSSGSRLEANLAFREGVTFRALSSRLMIGKRLAVKYGEFRRSPYLFSHETAFLPSSLSPSEIDELCSKALINDLRWSMLELEHAVKVLSWFECVTRAGYMRLRGKRECSANQSKTILSTSRVARIHKDP